MHEATTDSQRVYQIPFLQPGGYDLRIEANGFETTLVNQVDYLTNLLDVIGPCLPQHRWGSLRRPIRVGFNWR